MRTREQDRSLACWRALTSRFGEDYAAWREGRQDEAAYLAAVKKTASRIYVSGLGPAIAFLRSRKKPINGLLADDLAALALAGMGSPPQGITLPVAEGSSLDLIRRIREATDVATVAWATEEALAACTWLMRYLEGAGVSPSEDEE
ncbi:MAG: type III-B CRISPR module-associated protein Cmr5 [Armatimonadota bacterium]